MHLVGFIIRIQEITLELLFILFTFCNSADDFDVGGDGQVFMVTQRSVGNPGHLSGNAVW